MCPNVENMMVQPITKRMKIIMSKFVSFHGRTLIARKMVEIKLFLQIQSINVVYPNVDNMIAKPTTKRKETIMSIQVCLLSLMNFDNMENGGKKAFLTNPKR